MYIHIYFCKLNNIFFLRTVIINVLGVYGCIIYINSYTHEYNREKKIKTKNNRQKLFTHNT